MSVHAADPSAGREESPVTTATPAPTLRMGVILASVREGRRGEAFARWILKLIAERPGVEPVLLDLRDHPLPAYVYPKTPTFIEGAYPDELPNRWARTVAALDGYVIVTPEYNHGYPGQLKNALDHVLKGWWYKPVGFVSYGGTGNGVRAVEQLRNVAVELRMVPVKGEVNIRLVDLATGENGEPTDPRYPRLAAAMLDQLLWWARAARQARSAEPPPA